VFVIRFDLLGMNACYFENLDNVPKWTGARDNATKQVIINTEWGALGKVRSVFI
jgi:hexokinase